MNISFVGLGKLGMPCALAAADYGHSVMGYDVAPLPWSILAQKKYPYEEPEVDDLMQRVEILRADSTDDIVKHGELIFVAVQTPHGEGCDGTVRKPAQPEDFDYSFLRRSIQCIAESAKRLKRDTTIVVISTVLPGTTERQIAPLLNEYTGFVYNPFFIAQTSVVQDYRHPEFVLLGVDRSSARSVEMVTAFYKTMHAPEKLRLMSVASAELTKVSYNMMLGVKILVANAIMEIAHKTGANCDDVTDALGVATDRIISKKYMKGGMGDGGNCHCRDALALSWLAEEKNLSVDIGGILSEGREAQTEWLAELAIEHHDHGKKPIVLLGEAYKKGTNLTDGSPAKLLYNILLEYDVKPYIVDPYTNTGSWSDYATLYKIEGPCVFIISTNHDLFYDAGFRSMLPPGSVLIDPWGGPDIEGLKVIRVGRA